MTEVRATAASGAQKGRKAERFDLIPPGALEQLALVYGMGAEKYDDWNWRAGYPWSWSYASLQRHLQAFWNGEDNDPESGRPHLAHAMWHCATLLTFLVEQPELDDRFRPAAPEVETTVDYPPAEAWPPPGSVQAAWDAAIERGKVLPEDPSDEDTAHWLEQHGIARTLDTLGVDVGNRKGGW